MPEAELFLLFVRPLNRLGEYVIIRKLEYFREGGSEKHLRDIRSMLAVSGDQMNRRELDEWIKQRGLAGEWQKATS